MVQWKKLLQVIPFREGNFKPQICNLSFRERCMDLVSFETADEYRHFAKIMFRGNIVIVIVSMLILRMINCTCTICTFICLHIFCFVALFTVTHSEVLDHNSNELPNLYTIVHMS